MKEAFPAVITPAARILILGTMPGEESLKRHEYYANPRNQFWRIMQALFDVPSRWVYADRVAGLQQNHIALWDVLHSCERIGSTDRAIKNAVPNDFASLFAEYPGLKVIVFNSLNASKLFKRWVGVNTSNLQKLILPSTSPAAAITFEKKVAAWAVLRTV